VRESCGPSTSSRASMAKGRSTTPRRTPRSSTPRTTPRNTPRGTPRYIAAPETAPTPGPGAYDPWSHSDSKKSAKNFSERKASAAFKSASDTSLRRSGAHIRGARDHVSYLRDMGDPGAYDPFAHMGIGTSQKSFNRSHQRGAGNFLSSSSQRLSWGANKNQQTPAAMEYRPKTQQLWDERHLAKEHGKVMASFLSAERDCGAIFLRAPVPGVGEYEWTKSERGTMRKSKSGTFGLMTTDRFQGAYKNSDTPCTYAPNNGTIAFVADERLKKTGRLSGSFSKASRADLFKTAAVRVRV